MNIKLIEQKFFESGHSQMECDAMHSVIQGEMRRIDVYTPGGFTQCIRRSCVKQPYKVQLLKFNQVIDYDTLNSTYFKQTAFHGIITAHHLRYHKKTSDGIHIEVEMADWIGINLQGVSYFKPGRAAKLTKYAKTAYRKRVGIAREKYLDLQSLATYMDEEAALFYQNLPQK